MLEAHQEVCIRPSGRSRGDSRFLSLALDHQLLEPGARTRTTRWGAFTARQRHSADSTSLRLSRTPRHAPRDAARSGARPEAVTRRRGVLLELPLREVVAPARGARLHPPPPRRGKPRDTL